jgi:hypothetical protein
MENFSVVANRLSLECLGWEYDGWDYLEKGEDPGYDFVRIDCEDGKTKWTPCDEQGRTFGDTHDTGDDKKSIQDAIELLKTGMAYEL